MFVDLATNVLTPSVGNLMQGVHFDPLLLRPFVDNQGQRCVLKHTGRMTRNRQTGKDEWEIKKFKIADLQRAGLNHHTWNAQLLTKQAWQELDRRITMQPRERLRAWNDLAASATISGFNAMGKMTFEYQAATDVGEARIDMDAITDGRRDRPLLNLKSVPLPIIHADFHFSEREIAVSRNTGMPLDTAVAEMHSRRIDEMVERLVIGTETGPTYGTVTGGPGTHTGTSTIYGYTNFPYRVTKTDLTTPSGTNPEAVMTDVLEMVETMQTNGFYGPYMLYSSTAYSRYLNDDYFRTGSTSAVRSLRERIMQIEGILDIRRLDFLTSGYQLLLVQLDGQVAQAIMGMEKTTLHWETVGGLQQNFKIMCIKVPLLRSPYDGVAGILHATTS